MDKKLHLFPVFFFIFSIINHNNCEIYTATTDLEELLPTEKTIINSLHNYIKSEEKRLNWLKQYLEIYQKQYEESIKDTQTFISNPINAYILIKHLTADLNHIETLINADLIDDFSTNLTKIRATMKLPNDEDLKGAAVALARLQETYNLETSSLAKGELYGNKYSAELSVDDCFELGRQLYKNSDYNRSILWMKEAKKRLNNQLNATIKLGDILEYLALSTYKSGNTLAALNLLNELLEIEPTRQQAIENQRCYKNELSKIRQEIPNGNDTIIFEDYKKLCRGEISLPIREQSRLKCRYFDRNSPFLRIAPFKIEEVHLEPDIWIFHNVLSDNEIEILQKLSKPLLKRAKIHDPDGGLLAADYRISKTAFLQTEQDELLAKIDRRVADMTGLSLETADLFQVVNYGIGGYYDTHYDCAKKDERVTFKPEIGNRIATVLFYLNDVQEGGATVFPLIRVSLQPKKGTAAFWFNLHASGDGDVLSLHGACPVLIGSKWAANQWLHERGQEFLRPCTRERPDERFIV